MEFKATKIDLKLELTTLTGEEIVKDNPTVTAGQAAALMQKMMDMDKEMLDKHRGDTVFAMECIDNQLSAIYCTVGGWWPDNFDSGTLLEIKSFVFNSLARVKKKETN